MTNRRVCRSTMQAEKVWLQLGSEGCEHVRQVMYMSLRTTSTLVIGNPSTSFAAAFGHMACLWMIAGCRPLSDHLLTGGMLEVSVKHLAIDLTSLRQEVSWKPHRVAISTMVADALTKEMKATQLDEATSRGWVHFIFEQSTGVKTDVRPAFLHHLWIATGYWLKQRPLALKRSARLLHRF